MATNEKNLLSSFNTQITNVNNPSTEPAVNYNNLVEVSLDSVGFDYTGTTLNKFVGNANYKDTFVVNYIQ